VDLAAKAIHDANYRNAAADLWGQERHREEARRLARAALDAVAGLLLPEGSETRTEWGTRITLDDGRVDDVRCESEEFARRRVALHAERRATWPGWRATAELLRRTVITTPWDAVRLAEGDNKPSQDHAEEV
jgi:hypothetical protein